MGYTRRRYFHRVPTCEGLFLYCFSNPVDLATWVCSKRCIFVGVMHFKFALSSCPVLLNIDFQSAGEQYFDMSAFSIFLLLAVSSIHKEMMFANVDYCDSIPYFLHIIFVGINFIVSLVINFVDLKQLAFAQ